jgi:phosphoribosylaminoimidazole-succinocarboxamide synthase
MGPTAAAELGRLSRIIYAYGCSIANKTSIIIVDTTFEFSRAPNGRIISG